MGTTTQQQQNPTILDGIAKLAGTGSSIVSGLISWSAGVTKGYKVYNELGDVEAVVKGSSAPKLAVNQLLNNPAIAAIAAYVGTALALYSFYKSIRALLTGQGSWISVLMSGGALGVAIYAMGYVGPFLAMAWAPYLAIMAAIVVITVLVALFGGGPSPEEKAAKDLATKLTSVIWTQGPMAVVGLGTAAILLGMPQGRTPPVMSTLTVPAYYLANALLTTSGFANIPLGKSQAPTVLIEPGAKKGDPEKVMIVNTAGSNSHGDAMITIQTFELYKNIQFVSSQSAPGNACYIPAFIDKPPKPNDAYIKGLTTQNKLLESILNGALTTQGAQSAMQVASAANKDCIDPTTAN